MFNLASLAAPPTCTTVVRHQNGVLGDPEPALRRCLCKTSIPTWEMWLRRIQERKFSTSARETALILVNLNVRTYLWCAFRNTGNYVPGGMPVTYLPSLSHFHPVVSEAQAGRLAFLKGRLALALDQRPKVRKSHESNFKLLRIGLQARATRVLCQVKPRLPVAWRAESRAARK